MMRFVLMFCLSMLAGSSVLADEHAHKNEHDHEREQTQQRKRERKHHDAHRHHRDDHKRRHKAHEHGQVNVSIAVEGKKARIIWDSPAESVYGFEHTAKSEADKKQQKEGLEKFEQQFFTMFAFAKDAGCELRKVDYEVVTDEVSKEDKHAHKHHSSHAEVEAKFGLECQSPLAGTDLKVDIARVFPKVKKVRINMLSGKKQSAKTLSAGKGTIKI